MLLQLREEVVEEIADEEIGALFVCKAGGRFNALHIFQDEAAGTGEKLLQRSEGPGAASQLLPQLIACFR